MAAVDQYSGWCQFQTNSLHVQPCMTGGRVTLLSALACMFGCCYFFQILLG
jgi:hypothetical protein